MDREKERGRRERDKGGGGGRGKGLILHNAKVAGDFHLLFVDDDVSIYKSIIEEKKLKRKKKTECMFVRVMFTFRYIQHSDTYNIQIHTTYKHETNTNDLQ